HTALCNIIEHIFGVIKCQWCILNLPLEYTMDVQACIPTAMCALHNIINHFDAKIDDYPLAGSDQEEPAMQMGHETEHANQHCEAITQAMWADYVVECLH
ncbi:hypothetical protein SCLCIDRAFT_121230, partial [Scleroderma citrinum Foug A]